MALAIARGGDTSRFPANTLPALRSAFTAGADAVTADIALTADGYAVLLGGRLPPFRAAAPAGERPGTRRTGRPVRSGEGLCPHRGGGPRRIRLPNRSARVERGLIRGRAGRRRAGGSLCAGGVLFDGTAVRLAYCARNCPRPAWCSPGTGPDRPTRNCGGRCAPVSTARTLRCCPGSSSRRSTAAVPPSPRGPSTTYPKWHGSSAWVSTRSSPTGPLTWPPSPRTPPRHPF